MSHPEMNGILSCLLAVCIGIVPLAAIVVFGFDVPVVMQPEFTHPAPSMKQNDVWSQTFIFPDRSVSGIALRPGTYGRKTAGRIDGWIGPIFLLETKSDSEFSRQFTIDLQTIRDNRWHSFHFPALRLRFDTPCILRLTGSDISAGDTFTLWRNTMDPFPDGVFRINMQPQRGDLAFKILSRVRGMDALRMVKSRWQEHKSAGLEHIVWPAAPAVALPFCLGIAFLLLMRRPGKSPG